MTSRRRREAASSTSRVAKPAVAAPTASTLGGNPSLGPLGGVSPQSVSALPPEQVSLAILFTGLSTFLSSIDGLRDLMRHSAAGLAELDQTGAVAQLERLRRRTIDLLPMEKRAAAGAAAEKWMVNFIELSGQLGTAGVDDALDTMKAELATLILGFEAHPLVQELVTGFYGFLLERSRQELLFRTIVISAVSAFEAHVAGLMTEWLRRYPRELMSKDRDVSIEDVLAASSPQAIVDAVIEHRVERILRQGFPIWAEWLEPRIKFSVPDLAMDLDATREVFARRNLYVHSGGAVTRRYKDAVRAPLELGRELAIDEAYVTSALDRLVVLGVSLAVALRRQLAPGLPRLGIDMSVRAVEHLMRRDRWAAVLRAAEIEERLAESRDDRLVAKVNTWLARKHLHGISAIHRAVRAWNVSGLSPIYPLARHALLDEREEALRLAGDLVKQGLVDGGIVDWPIFAELAPDLSALFREWPSAEQRAVDA